VFVLPGCDRCSVGLDELKAVAASFGSAAFAWHERNLLQNIDDAVKLGILSSPAIAIDGKLAFTSLPSPQQLRDALGKHVGA
jgi:hypothetical protein